MSATGARQRMWRLCPGEYLGEISALCFLHLPHHLSSPPFLLAGTGSQFQVYDLNTGKIVRSLQVFEGIRVHGICLENLLEQSEKTHLVFRVAIYGERRVKILNLQIESLGQKPDLKLSSVISLPKFSHWVLDACFLKKESASSSEDAYYLAIGCSDNSVHFWNIPEQNMFSEVKCSERCLLYSMAMFGNKIESLLIASGTIFNEIVVWKVLCQNHAMPLDTDTGDSFRLTNHDTLLSPTYDGVLVNRLVGHEGSIFRITWFSSGMKLVSVSDDRSARLWEVQPGKDDLFFKEHDRVNYTAGPVLFGHNGRIWDCCIFDSLIVTAGEDCTFRVWNQDGQELNEIKEHVGRGVWRCLCDPKSSLLVTAGFDSAIRVRQLIKSSKGSQLVLASENSSDREEFFTLSMPNYLGNDSLDRYLYVITFIVETGNYKLHVQVLLVLLKGFGRRRLLIYVSLPWFSDLFLRFFTYWPSCSKSEYVRCLHFSNKDSLFVATNNGYLYHVSLVKSKDFVWTEISHISKDAPIICMDILSTYNNISGGHEDWIALGDGKGNLTVILVVESNQSPKVEITVSWKAEKERNLLGSFWCKSLQNRFIFTANPGGRLKLWSLYYDSPFASQVCEGHDVFLIAEFVSCLGIRLLCVDASYDEELLVCGDNRGNLLLFSLPTDLLCSSSKTTETEALPICYFKGAHGLSSVSSVSIASLSFDQVEIRSTGADGCICYLQHSRGLPNMEFVGMKQVKELSAVQFVYDTATGNYAVGFVSSNFMIWNLTTASKVLQITCGGWRRPTSYFVGDIPEIMSCFSFVKDDVIYIHRRWLSENNQQLYPRNIHLQFHGREIHSLCFISGQPLFNAEDNQTSESCWITTGCEDGTMRLTRYEPGVHKWSSSDLLGMHVAGSAIRSICSVPIIHLFTPDSIDDPDVAYTKNKIRDTFLLISVGAKRVISVWKRVASVHGDRIDVWGDKTKKNENRSTGLFSGAMPSLSFQWLSSDIPVTDAGYRNRQKLKGSFDKAEHLSTKNVEKNAELEVDLEINLDNDFRHLAVTAFLVKETAGSRISICFVVIASSDATVTIRALVLPFRLWFDVATLASTSSPVLTLQHVVVPKPQYSEGNMQSGNLYMAVTGSTDGSVSIWNLTASVENFMMHVSGLPFENCSGIQKRPQTGRGSQGGRHWRSIGGRRYAKMKPDQSSIIREGKENGKAVENHNEDHFPSSLRRKYLSDNPCAVAASHVLQNVHQSGVNCLHVSEVKDAGLSADSTLSFYIVTGGDDQAINYFRCDLRISPSAMTADNQFHHLSQSRSCGMNLTCVGKITSAHSSAVKGAWTDGRFVFSVGLDQRVRCWSFDGDKISECGHLIISVPEPEALDVKICGRNFYRICVGGRGIQMVEFSLPHDGGMD